MEKILNIMELINSADDMSYEKYKKIKKMIEELDSTDEKVKTKVSINLEVIVDFPWKEEFNQDIQDLVTEYVENLDVLYS